MPGGREKPLWNGKPAMSDQDTPDPASNEANGEGPATRPDEGVSARPGLPRLLPPWRVLLHVDDRIGSIEQGKDADLVILSGGPFDFQSRVEKVIVNGKVVYGNK